MQKQRRLEIAALLFEEDVTMTHWVMAAMDEKKRLAEKVGLSTDELEKFTSVARARFVHRVKSISAQVMALTEGR